MKLETAKICLNELCENEIGAYRRKFCSPECGVMHHNRIKSKVLSLTPIGIDRKGDKCKWCIDSNHDRFCCPQHKMFYRQFRQGFDIEMAKEKPIPTKEQLKRYKKIEYALINVKT